MSYFDKLARRTWDAAPTLNPKLRLSEDADGPVVHGHWEGSIAFCIPKFQEIDLTSMVQQHDFARTMQTVDIRSDPSVIRAVDLLREWVRTVRSNRNTNPNPNTQSSRWPRRRARTWQQNHEPIFLQK